ncbi:hypothetical protein QFZ63_005129 [Streptomyces sp. B3I7]|nr:hypothetical protein [Streptomyces sp. B3I7]
MKNLIRTTLEWLRVVLFGRGAPTVLSVAPPGHPDARAPYVWGAGPVDVPLRVRDVTVPQAVRPLPGFRWALPPADWAAYRIVRPRTAPSDSPPGPACTCPPDGAREPTPEGER